jgi:hypothetical protein
MVTSDIKDASIPELLSGVMGDVKDIAGGHATKMRDEVKVELVGLKNYLMKVMVAVGVGTLGAILLAHAFALILDAAGLPLWASYLISAAIFVAIGAVIVKRLPSDKTEIDLYPENALRDLKRDVNGIKDDVAHAT